MSDVNQASRMQSDQARREIEAQAISWLLEINGTEPGIRRWVKFDRWLSENPEHEAIYCRFEENFRRLLLQCASSSSIGVQPVPAKERVDKPRRPSWVWGPVAAASAAVLAVPLFLLFQVEWPRTLPVDTIETLDQGSEPRTLDNGVVVALGANSTLSLGSGENQGRVSLLKGQASFDVPADLTRPFVVSTFLVDASTLERAKFAVAVDTSVSFKVHEGIVTVSATGAPKGAPVIVLKPGADYRVPVDASGSAVAKIETRVSAKPVT